MGNFKVCDFKLCLVPAKGQCSGIGQKRFQTERSYPRDGKYHNLEWKSKNLL